MRGSGYLGCEWSINAGRSRNFDDLMAGCQITAISRSSKFTPPIVLHSLVRKCVAALQREAPAHTDGVVHSCVSCAQTHRETPGPVQRIAEAPANTHRLCH